MTIVGELGIVYGVTGVTVMGIKLLKRKGLHLPDWVLRDMLDVFLR
ncbi:hypothetical protein LW858_31540 (plasmid) [Bacillus cereus]|nr:hypothetical protein [Bacillus cereus]UIJ69903.1 hypothetical protein LW858_31540 [Bacillus cereus]